MIYQWYFDVITVIYLLVYSISELTECDDDKSDKIQIGRSQSIMVRFGWFLRVYTSQIVVISDETGLYGLIIPFIGSVCAYH